LRNSVPAKILVTAGGGGHTGYAVSLAKTIFRRANLIFLIDYEDTLSEKRLKPYGKIRKLNKPRHPETPIQIFLLRLILCFFQAIIIWLKERPEIVVSTGSNIAVPICIVGWIFRSKVVNVEDSIRIFTVSKTSKYIEYLAELTLLQWREQLKLHPKKGVYVGLLLPKVKASTRDGGIVVSAGSLGFKELYDTAAGTSLTNVLLVASGLNHEPYKRKGWTVVDRLIGLDEALSSARVVVTHLGYTVWEALNYGVPVVVVPNPRWRRVSISQVGEVCRFISIKGHGIYLAYEELTPLNLEAAVRRAEMMSAPTIERGSEKAVEIILGLKR